MLLLPLISKRKRKSAAAVGLHIKGLLKVYPRLRLVAVTKISKEFLHEKAPATTTIKSDLDT
jgi:hypothetical protein